MPYTFTQTTDAMGIKEQEYATAKEVKFTKFTSCVGIISRKGTMLTGVHLVMVAKDSSSFDEAAALKIAPLLGSSPDEIYIFGGTESWKAAKGGVGQGFAKLLSALSGAKVYNWGDGTFGAKIGEDGKIEITY